MALKKKNVFQGFMQDDYTPSEDQQIVKYVMGKGNNLHEVETHLGTTFLVSMPKKFRQTVWLKRGDCIVIDPVIEGKKVLGEITCVIPPKCVIDLINSGDFPAETVTANTDMKGSGDALTNGDRKAALLAFFTVGNKNQSRDSTQSPTLPPSNSSSEVEDSDEDDEDNSSNDEDEADENDSTKQTKENNTNKDHEIDESQKNTANQTTSSIPVVNEVIQDDADGYKSRVQFLTSGIVTVTSIVNDITSLENGLQSLDFETEDSSEECNALNLTKEKNDFRRQANTIRIQVNYPPEEKGNTHS